MSAGLLNAVSARQMRRPVWLMRVTLDGTTNVWSPNVPAVTHGMWTLQAVLLFQL